jgi:hypothetical protein
MLTFNNNAQIIFPKEFPSNLKNKVICGTASTDGKMFDGSLAFLKFPYKLTISDDGIFAEYNLGEKFGRDEWGQTQTIKVLTEWKRVPTYDQYDELRGYVIHYKISDANLNNSGEFRKHSITALSIETRLDGSGNILIIDFRASAYKDASIASNYVQKYFSICGTVLSKEERLKQELQKKEIDKVTLLKINECLTKNNINEAFQMYQKLINKDEELLKEINQKISYNEYKVKEFLSEKKIDSAIHYYSKNPPSQNIKLSIQQKLSEINISEEDFPINEELIKFVRDSLFVKYKFRQLESNQYTLHIRNNGECLLTDSLGVTKFNFQIPNQMIPKRIYDSKNQIEYYINSKSKFNYLVDLNQAFVAGVRLDPLYKEHIESGAIVFYYVKKNNKEFILTNKNIYKNVIAEEPDRSKYDKIEKLNLFQYEDNTYRRILAAPIYINGIKCTNINVINNDIKIKIKEY